MRKQILLGLTLSAALLGVTLTPAVYAQNNTAAGAATGATIGAGSQMQAGNRGGRVTGGANIDAKVANQCPDGTPMPSNGACLPTKGRAGKPSATAPGVNAGANANANALRTAPTDQENAGRANAGNPAGRNAASDNSRTNAPQNAPTGNATTNVNVTVQQRTQIVDAIRTVNVRPATVNFDLRVGVAIPHRVALHPLPARVVRLVPRYRGYLFFLLADGRIVVVQPHSLRIVAIL